MTSRRFLEAAGLLVILLASSGLRFWALDAIPVGWHHDEAIMGVLAAQVYRDEYRPLFFPQYLGQEPLYVYMSALAMAALGGNTDILPLRVAAAVSGVLTVLVAWGMARLMFGRWVALATAALLGFSYWQVTSSRMGIRSITQPLLEGLAVLLLWAGRELDRRGRRGWAVVMYVGSGAAVGGALYTYLGARSFPLVFGGFAIWLLVRRWSPSWWRGGGVLAPSGRWWWPRGSDVRNVALVVVGGLLAAAPLGIYFLVNPGQFGARLGQTSILNPEISGGAPLEFFLANVWKLIATFTVAGETLWRYNLSGRPVFVGLVMLAFLAGLVILVVRTWRKDDAAAMIVIWVAAMSFPATLSWDVGAYTLRAMGLVPALYVIPAVAIVATAAGLIKRLRGRSWARPVVAGVAVLVIALDGVWTTWDYFVVWAPSFGAAYEGELDVIAEARYLGTLNPDEGPIVAGSDYLGHATVNHLSHDIHERLLWVDGDFAMVFPTWSRNPVTWVFAFQNMPPHQDWLFPEGSLIADQPFPVGIDANTPPPPMMRAWRLQPAQLQARQASILAVPGWRQQNVRFGDQIELVAASAPRRTMAGGEIEVLGMWRVLREPAAGDDYTMVVNLLDPRQESLVRVDANGYPTSQWRAGDLILTWHRLPLPAGFDPGVYSVSLDVLNRKDNRRLRAEPGSGVLPGVRVVAAMPQIPPRTLDVRFANGARLAGIGQPPRRAGEPVIVDLYWSAERRLERDYTVTVQLLDSGGRLVAQSDALPAGGLQPTTAWEVGEVIRDRHRLELPADLAPGEYRLTAGLYAQPFVAREALAGGGDTIDLGTIRLP